jgi:hypothetical protein
MQKRRWFFWMTSVFAMLAVMALLRPSGENDGLAAQESKSDKTAKKQTKKKGKAETKRRFEPAAPPKSAEEANVPVLSSGDSYDDFASVAQAKDGALYAAYAAYFDGHDQIRLHKRLPTGQWSTRTYVPTVEARADVWMPQLAVDAKDRLWVIWCEQVGQSKGKSGNWDVYARALVGHEWGPLHRISNDPKPDINPHVAVDRTGVVYVVWQGHADNTGDVMLSRLEGDAWSRPLAVTRGPESDWYPHVAIDRDGVAWIAFDSYRNGDYDVFLTSVKGSSVGKVLPIATSRYYEAHASVACTPDGSVWVAWEQGGYLWGKDQGYWLRRDNRNAGTPLGSERHVRVAAVKGDAILAAPAVDQALGSAGERGHAAPELASDAAGRLWLRFRQQKVGGMRQPGRFTRYWTENVTFLTAKGWSPAVELAGSTGRISVFSRILPLSGAEVGTLAVAYSGDGRGGPNYHQPQKDRTMVALLAAPKESVGYPELAAYQPPAPPAGAREWDFERERRHLERIRAYRTEIDGKPHRIVRGDLHRHTELSWDVGPGNDGSYLDFYRYMIDVAGMDFGGLSDHQGGGHYPYWWWLTEKSCDLYYLAPRFVPLYGYERSAQFPNGHRNIFHSYRGVPVFPFQITLTQTGVFPGVGTGALVDNDTKLLYQYLHKTGGVAISHTSGTSTMGTDWRDNDPVIEPVVEIYQGARNSYETLEAPRVHATDAPPDQAPGGFQKAGLVWNAYAKGYRLGTIAASDHGSTHISYGLVYVPENDRSVILDGIRKRHTYGGTDNLIVECRGNGRFMGDEAAVPNRPSLELRVIGTANVARVDLVRNNEYIHSTEPGKEEVTVKYTDMQPKKGLNLYYFRVLQADGEVAWASPVWLNYQPK